MRLYICGARGSYPVAGREYGEFGCATTCYVLREDDYAIVLDCGSGLWNAREILKGCTVVDILLTHMHYDHILGLPMLGAVCPGAKVKLYANFGAWYGLDTIERFLSEPFWPVCLIPRENMVEVHSGEKITLQHGVTAEFRRQTHDGALLIALHKNGEELCFTGDYEHGRMPLDSWAKECDLLIYDGTYAPEEYAEHEGWGHSTWEEGCQLAERAHAKRLVISHHSPDHDDRMLSAQEHRAQEIFPATHFAREGEYLDDWGNAR